MMEMLMLIVIICNHHTPEAVRARMIMLPLMMMATKILISSSTDR